jgi:imidazolonepropionase-like amidohydrolase
LGRSLSLTEFTPWIQAKFNIPPSMKLLLKNGSIFNLKTNKYENRDILIDGHKIQDLGNGIVDE